MGEKQVVEDGAGLAAQVAVVVNTANNLTGDNFLSWIVQVDHAELLLEVFVESIFNGHRELAVFLFRGIGIPTGFIGGFIIGDILIEVVAEFKGVLPLIIGRLVAILIA